MRAEIQSLVWNFIWNFICNLVWNFCRTRAAKIQGADDNKPSHPFGDYSCFRVTDGRTNLALQPLLSVSLVDAVMSLASTRIDNLRIELAEKTNALELQAGRVCTAS